MIKVTENKITATAQSGLEATKELLEYLLKQKVNVSSILQGFTALNTLGWSVIPSDFENGDPKQTIISITNNCLSPRLPNGFYQAYLSYLKEGRKDALNTTVLDYLNHKFSQYPKDSTQE